MVSISGVDVKFGRILALIGLSVGLVILYKNYGSGSKVKESVSTNTAIGGKGSNKDSAVHRPEVNLDDPGAGLEKQKLKESDSSKYLDANPILQKNAKPIIDVLKLEVRNVTLSVDGNRCGVEYIEVSPEPADPRKPSLLLLHGQKYNATTWNKGTGTMSKLKEWGYRAVAVNLTHGETDKCVNGLSEAKGVLLHELVKTLKLQKVVVVSPSMSGEFSIPYIIEENYFDEISGYIPIAPVILPKYTEEWFKKVKVKTLILHGANDSSAVTSLKLLKHIPTNEVSVLPDAGHACYLDQPDKWHEQLKNFVNSL